MFGYVTIDQLELKFKDYYKYRAYYCGLCHALKEQHGQLSRITVGYDMTFLAVLLDGLYDSETVRKEFRCPLHPFVKRVRVANEFLDYASSMGLFLAWLKCEDDWKDEHKLHSRIYGGLIHGKVRRIEELYPERTARIRKHMEDLAVLETEKSDDFEQAAGCFGRVTEEIFAYRDDQWQPLLRRMGFYLGKFIYLLDAFLDLKEDRQKDLYNPLMAISGREDFQETIYNILMLMISEAAASFERLPIDENMDILRNILYSGVWMQYRKEVSDEGSL
ncbi:MAG: hypothetical protein IKD85_05085 [Firmicutes bacterium]|nr:hypothetical protein [Bacillota bacterium]